MTSPLTLVFMGTPDFAVPSLQALLDSPHQVKAVFCQPDRRRGRGKKLAPPPVKVLAQDAGIPVLQPESVRRPEVLAQIRDLQPDLMVVVAYGKILPLDLLSLPRLGTINVHGSLLPQYRGAAPIQWAVINGEKETGITIMQMDEGMDTGDILCTQTIPIKEDDTAGSLFAHLATLGGVTLQKAVDLLAQGKLTPQKQDEALATMAPMLSKDQGLLDWSKPAQELHCLIRGLDPWPSAYGFLEGKRYRFFSPEIVHKTVTEPPGTLCAADQQGLLVATGEQYLRIREIQMEGKKRMTVQALLCGMSFPLGEQFSSQ